MASSNWSGVLRANSSTPLRLRLAMPVSVPAGGISNRPVTPEVGHRSHAQVPANRRGDLADQPLEHLPTVVDDLTVGVGQQPGSRIVGRDGPGQRGETRDGGLHVHGVEGSRDAERDQPGARRRVSRQRGQLLDFVPAATIWPLPLLLAAVRPWASRAASTSSAFTADDGRHRGRGARRWLRP